MMTSNDEIKIAGHELHIGEADHYAQRAGFLFYGECGCHNPDGNGEGRCDTLASSREEIEDWHHDHLISL